MRKCGRCKIIQSDNNFSWKSIEKKIYQTMCKACYRQYRKEYYIKNKDKEINRIYKRRDGNKMRMFNYLSGKSCVDCGEHNQIVLQFDHIKGKKILEVSRMLRDGWSWSSIMAEINKCEIRCANCHIKRTAKHRGWKRMLWQNVL